MYSVSAFSGNRGETGSALRRRRSGRRVLLGDGGDVLGLRVLGEQVIERLVLARTPVGRNRLVPFVGVVEFRIDVEDHAAKRIEPVADDLTDLELGDARLTHMSGNRPG